MIADIYCAYHLTCYYLKPDTCLILLITCHLLYYHLSCDYHISEILSCYAIFYTVILHLQYLCTTVTPLTPETVMFLLSRQLIIHNKL